MRRGDAQMIYPILRGRVAECGGWGRDRLAFPAVHSGVAL